MLLHVIWKSKFLLKVLEKMEKHYHFIEICSVDGGGLNSRL